jgi:hypothetical protein
MKKLIKLNLDPNKLDKSIHGYLLDITRYKEGLIIAELFDRYMTFRYRAYSPTEHSFRIDIGNWFVGKHSYW